MKKQILTALLVSVVAVHASAMTKKVSVSHFTDSMKLIFENFKQSDGSVFASFNGDNGVNISGPSIIDPTGLLDNIVEIWSDNKLENGYPRMSITYHGAQNGVEKCDLEFIDGPYADKLNFRSGFAPQCAGLNVRLQQKGQYQYELHVLKL